MKRTLLLTAICLLAPAAAWAGEGSFWETHGTLIEVAVSIFNFAIFLYLIIRFGGPAIKDTFKNNAREYQDRLNEATDLLGDAKEIHQEWAKRQATLEQESERIIQDVRSSADRQAEQIIENARQVSQRLVEDAKRTASNELMRTREDLQHQLAEAVLARTGEKLKHRLTPAHQRKLIDEAIKKMEASG